jgi:hypothetical protein
MLETLEKIQWGVSGFLVVVFLGMFVWPGLPAPIPAVLPPIRTVSAETFQRGLTAEQKKRFKHKTSLASSRSKSKSRSPGAVRQPEYREVPPEISEVATDLRQAAGQMQLVKWTRNSRGKTVRIEGFKGGSYLPDVGFESGDEIELIDGMPLDFLKPDGVDEGEAKQLYYQLKDRFLAGEPILVTVNRNGKRITLGFRPKEDNARALR